MITILFARRDSIYKKLPGCDVYDADRDAKTWPGGTPIVAHPPCRAWGGLSYFARPLPGEKDLAPWAVEKIRQHGGVLEHPARSKLWHHMSLPPPGHRDKFGGSTIGINQSDFGHRAEKKTFLYIVGCALGDIPHPPLLLAYPSHVIETRKKESPRPSVTKKEREATPRQLAGWLIAIARSCE